MERNDFLKLIHKVSQLKNGIKGLKINVPAQLQVSYNGIKFYPIAYELKFIDGMAIHSAVLHDLQADNVIYVPLDKVIEWS